MKFPFKGIFTTYYLQIPNVRGFVIISLCLTIGLCTCTPVNYVANQNLDYLYNANQDLKPKTKVFHPNPDETRIFVGLNPKAFTLEPETKKYQVELKYLIYKDYELSGIIDSGAKELQKTLSDKNPDYLETSFELPQFDKKSLIAIVVKDKVSNRQARSFTYCYPYKQGVHQRYLIRKKTQEEMLFGSFLKKGQSIKVNHTKEVDSITLSHSERNNFEASPPPFITQYKNSDLKGLKTSNGKLKPQNTYFKVDKNGFYTAKQKDAERGLSFRVIDGSYPILKTPSQLKKPLIYITSSETYNNLSEEEPAKTAVDNFWLDLANNDKEKAKKMIEGYYKRVEKANQLFTNYKKGWKTDKGMIYIVFGPPQMVYRSNQGESWIYPERDNLPEMLFKFKRQSHAYCHTYYVLQRSDHFKRYYFNRVDQIRSGGNPSR